MSIISSKPLLFLLHIITIVGCSTSELTLSVLEPASVTLPSTIRRISVFPSPGIIPDKHVMENISNIILHETADVSQIKVGYLNGIFDIISNSPRFDRVIFSDSSFAGFLNKNQLYWDDLRKICSHDTTDVVLFLQKAICTDQMLLNEFEGDQLYFGIYKIINQTEWSFVQPFRETTLMSFVSEDRLTLNGMFGLKGEPEYLLYRACYTSGVLSGRKIAPFWQDTVRTYFTGPGRDMKDAAKFAEKNRWYNATGLWEEVVESGSNKKASRAAYNMAIAFEQDDDLEQAYSWLLYADSLHSTKHSHEYLKILENRIRIKPELEQQLAGR